MEAIKSLSIKWVLVVGLLLIGMVSISVGEMIVWKKSPVAIHEFTGLPLTTDGWTDFRYMIKEQNLYQDARVIFVSSSEGSDSTAQDYTVSDLTFDGNGIFQPIGPVNAYETLSAGANRLRTGYPDIMLLKRGDSWSTNFWNHRKSGRSITERMIIGSYGTASERPVVMAPGAPFGYSGGGGWVMGTPINYKIWTGIRFYAAHRDPNHPNYLEGSYSAPQISMLLGGQHLLFEDIHSEFIYWNLQASSSIPWQNIALRRNMIEKSYSTSAAHAQGIYVSSTHGILIEGNTFYHNGWRSDLNNSTVFNHNIYMDSNNKEPIVIRNNFILSASANGMQMRAGGQAVANVYVRNPIAGFVASPDGEWGEEVPAGGTTTDLLYNVVLEPVDMPSGDSRAHGIQIIRSTKGNMIGNIHAHNLAGASSARGMSVTGFDDKPANCLVVGNIHYNYPADAAFRVSSDLSSGVTLIENEFSIEGGYVVNNQSSADQVATSSNNAFWSTNAANSWMRIGSTNMSLDDWKSAVGDTTTVAEEPNYPDPYRTVSTYNASLDFANNYEAFVAELRKQTRTNWRGEFTARSVVNYIREGFGRGPVPDDY